MISTVRIAGTFVCGHCMALWTTGRLDITCSSFWERLINSQNLRGFQFRILACPHGLIPDFTCFTLCRLASCLWHSSISSLKGSVYGLSLLLSKSLPRCCHQKSVWTLWSVISHSSILEKTDLQSNFHELYVLK